MEISRFYSKRMCLKIFFMIFAFSLIAFNAFAKEAILYSQYTDDYWQIWQMDVDGNNKKQITTSEMDKRDPAWLESEQKIAYRNHNGELFLADVDGANEQEILDRFNHINNPVFLNSRPEFVFVRFMPGEKDRGSIWKSDLSGQETTVLARVARTQYQPSVSSDDSRVVYVSSAKDSSDQHVWMMNMDGSNKQQLTFNKGFNLNPGFSVDGLNIIYSSNQEDENFEIYTMNIKTKKIVRLTHNDYADTNPSFSKDGKKILYVTAQDGRHQIWKMDHDGQNKQKLTNESNKVFDPLWIKFKDKDLVENEI